MKEFIVFIIVVLIVIFGFVKLAQAFKYSNDWVEISPNHFIYVKADIIQAEVWAGDRAGAWEWIVYLKTSFDEPYSGTEFDIEDAFKEVRRIMFGGVWM